MELSRSQRVHRFASQVADVPYAAGTPRRPSRPISTGIVEQLRDREREICQGIYDHIRTAVPDPASDFDSEYQQGMRLAIAALVEYGLDKIAAGGRRTQPLPRPAAEQARRAARAGVSLGLVIRRYVAAYTRLVEYVIEQAARRELPSHCFTLQLLRRAQDLLLEQLIAGEHEYNNELERPGHLSDQRRLVIVRQLLRQEPVNRVELTKLDYELENYWHVGIVASAASERAVQVAENRLRCQTLVVVTEDGSIWAWLGAEHRISAQLVVDHLSDSDISLAIGEPRLGINGWRLTHGEALAAWPIAMRRLAGAIRCASVTLDAALFGNKALARLHQETYLMPLGDLRDGGHTARETLNAYFSCEGNIASTGAKLNVTRRTVENRLRTIAKRLGRPLSTCLPELQVALRLEALAARESVSFSEGQDPATS